MLVSVLSHNSAAKTVTTLRSLQRQTYPNYHLQLVDNASTDDTLQRVAREFPCLCVVRLTENLGYTGGNNRVLKQATAAEGYDYILLCNHDIEVDERAIEQLVETAGNCLDAGVVGGVEVRFVNGHRRAAGGGRYAKWTSRASFPPQHFSNLSPRHVACVQGALILFTSRALKAGVLFDENLFMYFDETDIGFQLEERGLHAYVDPRVTVNHNREEKRYNLREGYLMQRNRLYMMSKHGVWYRKLFYHAYAGLLELPSKVCVRILQGQPRYARACLHGHIDGLKGRMGRGRDF